MILNDVLVLHAALSEFLSKETGGSPRFSYACARNRRALAPCVEAYVEVANSTKHPVIGSYQSSREILLMQCAARDEKGGVKFIDAAGRTEVQLADLAVWEEKHGELLKQFPDVQTVIQTWEENLRTLRGTPVDGEPSLVQVAIKDLPATLAPRLVDALFPMLLEDEPAAAAQGFPPA